MFAALKRMKNKLVDGIYLNIPNRSWMKIVADLFKSKRNKKLYLIVTFYFLKFFDIFSTEEINYSNNNKQLQNTIFTNHH